MPNHPFLLCICAAGIGAVATLGAQALITSRPAAAQLSLAMPGGPSTLPPLAVAADSVGAVSHMWSADARTGQIYHCVAQAGQDVRCTSVPLPGAAQP